ncbi:hypothetical protein AMTR_s00033p00201170 [Amborella trichopoda]|uniref:Cdc23 domain-containing protein n=1 Tax=Amborella trichopoda TaxID=13333 RepID=U5CWJ7_AMBTC|nr:hypothetical protein AMTR_s00033p00201170 [Amborella trichopoda]
MESVRPAIVAREKRKEEEMIELACPLGKSEAVNAELVGLERELSTERKKGTIDEFGLYLYGVVLKEKGCPFSWNPSMNTHGTEAPGQSSSPCTPPSTF